ncbi:MAG: hypothetical protein P8Y44_03935 [Acidobacteriota bacterium]
MPRTLNTILTTAILMSVPTMSISAEIYVRNSVAGLELGSVTVYPLGADGDVAPTRTLQGSNAGLSNGNGTALDLMHGELFVVPSSVGGNAINVYPIEADGDVSPIRSIFGAATGLSEPRGVAVDPLNDEVIATNSENNSIRVFPRGADGNPPPIRIIEGPNTTLNFPMGLFVDLENDEIFVAGGPVTRNVLVFERTGNGDVAPVRVIAGSLTGFSAPQWIFVSLKYDEIYVSDRSTSKILVFSRTDEGDISPSRTISGATTGILQPQGVVLTLDQELLVSSEGNDSVRVFSRISDGDVGPTRTISGMATGLENANALATQSAAEDSVGFAGPLWIFYDGFESGDTSAWSSAQ